MTGFNATAVRDNRAAFVVQTARALLRPLAFLAAHLARSVQARRDIRHLMSLDDHRLKDVGITRGEIAPVVRRGR